MILLQIYIQAQSSSSVAKSVLTSSKMVAVALSFPHLYGLVVNPLVIGWNLPGVAHLSYQRQSHLSYHNLSLGLKSSLGPVQQKFSWIKIKSELCHFTRWRSPLKNPLEFTHITQILSKGFSNFSTFVHNKMFSLCATLMFFLSATMLVILLGYIAGQLKEPLHVP